MSENTGPAVGSNAELGPLPAPDYPAGSHGMLGEDCWSRATVLRLLTAERERWQEINAMARRVEQTAEALADENERLERVNANLRSLLARYRTETPLGHQPHMIALEVDKALGRA